MSNLSVVRLNGVDYNLEDENVRAMIAPTEASSTASMIHAPGTENEYFVLDNTLYRAITNIAIGDTITVGTNCAAVPAGISNKLGNEVADLKSAIDQDAIDNLLQVENIFGTTQSITFDSAGNVQSITHKDGSNNTVRTDVFTFAANSVTETRTLSTGESLTIVTNLTTLETTTTYAAA